MVTSVRKKSFLGRSRSFTVNMLISHLLWLWEVDHRRWPWHEEVFFFLHHRVTVIVSRETHLRGETFFLDSDWLCMTWPVRRPKPERERSRPKYQVQVVDNDSTWNWWWLCYTGTQYVLTQQPGSCQTPYKFHFASMNFQGAPATPVSLLSFSYQWVR